MVNGSLTNMQGKIQDVSVQIVDLTSSSLFYAMSKTSYPVILRWDTLKNAQATIILERMVLQVSQNGQDGEVPIFDTTSSKSEDILQSIKSYYAQDAEFETFNTVQKIKYKHLRLHFFDQVIHKIRGWKIAGSYCYECRSRSTEHYSYYYQIEDKMLWYKHEDLNK